MDFGGRKFECVNNGDDDRFLSDSQCYLQKNFWTYVFQDTMVYGNKMT